MILIMKTLAFLAFLAVLTTNVAAQSPIGTVNDTANFWLPYCKEFTKSQPDPDIDRLVIGICVGKIAGVAGVCFGHHSFLQITTVVVRWIDQRPQRWNENFDDLVLEALQEAWPCK